VNVVDTLIVRLELDASGFNKRIQDTKDALDRLEQQGAKGTAFTALKRNQQAATKAVEDYNKALEQLKKQQQAIAALKQQRVENIANHLPITNLDRETVAAEKAAKKQEALVEARQKKANDALSKQEDGLKKLDTTSNKTFKNMEHQGKAAANALNKIKYEVLALTSAFIGMQKIMSFISEQTGKGFALGNLAKNIAIDPKTLSAWENIAEKYGATSQDVAQSFSEVSAGYEAAVMGGQVSDEMAFLSRYVSLKDSEGKRRDLEAVMLDASTVLKKTEKDFGREKAVWFGKQFGFNEGMTTTLLGVTDKELDAQKERNALDEKDTEAAKARGAAWSKITDVFERFGVTLLTTVTPVFTDLAARFTKWAASDEGQAWIKKVTDSFEKLIVKLRDLDWDKVEKGAVAFWHGLEHVIEVVDRLVDSVGGLNEALKILFALFVADKVLKLLSLFLMFTPIGRIGKLITMLAAAIGGAALTHELLKDEEGAENKPGAEKKIGAENKPGAEKKIGAEKKSGELTAKGVLKAIGTVLWGVGETVVDVVKGVAGNIAAPKDLFQRQKQAIDILKGEGMTQQEAEAFAISSTRESNLIPTKKDKNSTSYGTGQWLKKRQKDYEKLYGHSMQSVTDERTAFKEQIRFMAWEAKNTESGAFEKIRAKPTAESVTQHYFRPAIANRSKDFAKDDANREIYEESLKSAYMNPQPYGKNSPETRAKRDAQKIIYPIEWAKDLTEREKARDINNNLNGANKPTGNRTQSQAVTIGNIVVNTRATDAVSISKDIAGALKNQLFAANANTAFV
jgi:hypothetical protein